jgi:hypothetical protein
MLKVTLIFAFIGPLLGAFGIWIVTGIGKVTHLADVPFQLFVAVGLTVSTYPIALLLGFLPAGLTGFLYAYLVNRKFLLKPNSYFTNAIVGAILGLLFTGAYALALHRPPGDPASKWYSIIAWPGAFSGAMLALAMTQRRKVAQPNSPAELRHNAGEAR